MTQDTPLSTEQSDIVFVYGALRSGTTLFRLMLNNHAEISNPGEVDFLFDHLHPDQTHPTGWRYDLEALSSDRIFRARGLTLVAGRDGCDLLEAFLVQLAQSKPGVLSLNVHRNAARIAETLPRARFIHLLRDGRDVGRSSIGMGWAGTSYYGVDHWIATEEDWQRARIDPDKVMELRFEDLMTDLTSHLGTVCSYLGVAFSPDMLRYYENTSYGPPDPSIAQKWRQKAGAHEIALIEGKCGALLEACGYALNGAPAHPGPVERLQLILRDRLMKWRHNIRRYGLPIFLAGKVTRLPGLGRWQREVQIRRDAKLTKLLK